MCNSLVILILKFSRKQVTCISSYRINITADFFKTLPNIVTIGTSLLPSTLPVLLILIIFKVPSFLTDFGNYSIWYLEVIMRVINLKNLLIAQRWN